MSTSEIVSGAMVYLGAKVNELLIATTMKRGYGSGSKLKNTL